MKREDRVRPGIVLALLTFAWPCWAQSAVTPSSAFVTWSVFLGVFAFIVFIFYAGLYRVLLRYFSPDHSKFVVYSLIALYGLTWIHLSSYVWFDWGFQYLWLRWVAVALALLWLVWFAIMSLRAETVRGH